jgi:hypothetical protein
VDPRKYFFCTAVRIQAGPLASYRTRAAVQFQRELRVFFYYNENIILTKKLHYYDVQTACDAKIAFAAMPASDSRAAGKAVRHWERVVLLQKGCAAGRHYRLVAIDGFADRSESAMG